MIFAALAGIAFGICSASTLYVSLDERAEGRAHAQHTHRHA